MRTTKIRITRVGSYNSKDGILFEAYANYSLLLRSARKAGDVEVINNYVLGRLNEARSYGALDFEKVQ